MKSSKHKLGDTVKNFKELLVCIYAGSIMPVQVSFPAGKRLLGLRDE